MRRFHRGLWKIGSLVAFPAWPCPTCESGSLRYQGDKYVLLAATSESNLARLERGDHWDPETIEERAAGLLHCNRCDEVVAFTALARQAVLEDVQTGADVVVPAFQPNYFDPAPPMIELPDDLDDEARSALRRSFALYWSDPSACVACIRTSLELMLDEQGIPRSRNDHAKGKRFRRSLHERLEIFSKKRNELRQHLMAIKWLGNVGTHDEATHETVLDAFEFVDYVFDELYRQRSRKLLKAAKAINRAKGPLRRRT